MSTRELVLELGYWTPLIALVGLSLGLVALKRVSSRGLWAKRLTTPPFYLISLPIATLLVATESLVWMIDSFGNILRLVDDLSEVWLAVKQAPFEMFVAGIFNLVLLFAMAISCQVLKWALFHQDWGTNHPAAKATSRLKIVFLLFVFVWTWMSVRFAVVDLEGGPFFLMSHFFS